ncbi:MAG: TonB-dependent receptor plug domain-containing protein, partial [Rugosibacter sp.]|nr:TonB-dependent receptor plug domain-containing protein [Rugosibacter sp.]
MKISPLATAPNFKLRPLTIALTSVLLASDPASAEEPAMEPIIVKAVRPSTPFLSSTAVDAADIASQRAATSDTASLLKNVPGVSLYGAGGVSSLPSIHGLADDRLRIKVDGADLVASCPNHMNSPLSYLDPNQVETLKVYAGITPVSVGGDSIGGAIIAETAAPEFAAPEQGHLLKGRVGAFYRSNNNARGGNLTATYATEMLNITYSGATTQADNYTAGGDFKTTTATGRPGHTLPLDEV